MVNRRALAALSLTAACIVPACRSQAEAALAPAPPAPASLAPVDAAGEYDSAWAYVAARYDADGDGRVTPEEHGRSEQGFGRLDHDGDGVLTEADWAARSGGPDLRAMMQQRRAMLAMAMVLQLDDQPLDMPIEELEAAAVEFDTNYDGALDAAEFEAASANSASTGLDTSEIGGMGRMMVPTDPWAALLAGADADGDEQLSKDELVAFYKDNAGNSDGNWNLAALTSMGGRGGAREAGSDQAAPQDNLLAQLGQVAPDFTLASEDGEDEVTLSDFAGKRPVVLIFGSYT